MPRIQRLKGERGTREEKEKEARERNGHVSTAEALLGASGATARVSGSKSLRKSVDAQNLYCIYTKDKASRHPKVREDLIGWVP